MYCNATVTLADGRDYVLGGHDLQSGNGLYKVNIFDPEIEAWVKRSQPCTRANWHRDPFGRELFARDPNAPFYDDCDPRDQQSTQPSDPRSEEHTSELQSQSNLVCRLLLEKKKKKKTR